LDTPVDTDPVLPQLRKLREGPGLSADRLAKMGAVMSALATSDPQVAYERLVRELSGFGDRDRVDALAVDFGLDLKRHLGREPTAREVAWLGDRRSGFAQVIGRDVKTLARWSDRTIQELRAKLLADTFTGDLYVVAAVKGDRIVGITLVQRHDFGSNPTPQTSMSFDNPTTESSMPCFVYGYPRDWRPRTLTLAVSFLVEPYPSRITAVIADSFFGLAFGEERYELPLMNDTAVCKVKGPRTDRLYGIWWRR
jgi:hypothetical protein